MTTTDTADVLIVGAGLAGISAALRAAELGLKPALIESGTDERYRSNSRWSGPVFHVAFRSMRSDPGELARALVESTGGFVREELAAALADNAGRSLDWLMGHGIEFGRVEPTEGWKDFIAQPLGYHDS